MTTTIIEPRGMTPAQALAFEQALASKSAAARMGDRIKAAPGKIRGWLSGGFRSLKIDAFVSPAWARLKAFGSRILRETRGLGMVNVAGAVLTDQNLRRRAFIGLVRAYNAARDTVSFALRPVGWLLAQARLSVVTTTVQVAVARAENVVLDLLSKAITKADQYQGTLPMQFANVWFRGALASKLIARFVPARFRVLAQLARLLVAAPVVVTRVRTTPADEVLIEEIEKRLHLDGLQQPVSTRVTLTVNGKETAAIRTVGWDDSIWYDIDGHHYEATDMPEEYARGIDLLARDANHAQRASEAPPLSRAAAREQARFTKREESKVKQAAHAAAGKDSAKPASVTAP